MRTLLSSASLCTLLVSSALGADMTTKAPPPAPAGYSWTGFYLGLNGGYGVGRNPSTLSNFTNPPPGILQFIDSWKLVPEGWSGGVQAGYNWQINHWVLGVEADFQGASQKDSACIVCSPVAGGFLVDQKMSWYGTVRGRLGWAAGPVLSYVTAGWAFARINSDLTIFVPTFPTTAASTHDTRSGWTVGTGLEAALAGNWTAKVEYLYMDLGTTSVPFTTSGTGGSRTGVESDIRNRIVRVGLNYRIGPTTGTGSATYPAPTFRNWSGFYAGANGGYGLARDPSQVLVSLSGVPTTADQWKESPGGYFGGIQAGYSWQASNFVYGLEADFQGANMKDNVCVSLCSSGIISETVEQKIKWFGTVRGRLGYATGPALFYVTGGLAYGNVKTTLTEVAGAAAVTTASVSDTNAGWTIGGGAEAALWGNWTAKTEYLYMDLGSITPLSGSTTFAGIGTVDRALTSDIRAHIFRGGVNYHF
jgi:outer membrane immunogenic protein